MSISTRIFLLVFGLVAASVFYYLVIYIPDQQELKSIQDQKSLEKNQAIEIQKLDLEKQKTELEAQKYQDEMTEESDAKRVAYLKQCTEIYNTNMALLVERVNACKNSNCQQNILANIDWGNVAIQRKYDECKNNYSE